MTTTVVVSPWNIATYPQGGGHWWVPLQYVLGLRSLGVDVWWMEEYSKAPGDPEFDADAIATFRQRMQGFGLLDRCVLWRGPERTVIVGPAAGLDHLGERADLLLNFNYELPLDVLDRFSNTALIDIDPGLLQFWVSEEQVVLAPHDHHITVGETVGTVGAKFSDLGISWINIAPPVCLDWWPVVERDASAPFTTVSGWWGGEWISGADGLLFDNNKRSAFLRMLDLPGRVDVSLELALNLAEPPNADTPGADDAERDLLVANGWSVRHSYAVAGDPMAYRDFIQTSAGEFSVAKPSCRHFENAWISDRTVCYLASGLPAVVEHTGASSILPDAEGLFRFTDADEAVRAFEQIDRHPAHHARAARALAEKYFDSKRVLRKVLEHTL